MKRAWIASALLVLGCSPINYATLDSFEGIRAPETAIVQQPTKVTILLRGVPSTYDAPHFSHAIPIVDDDRRQVSFILMAYTGTYCDSCAPAPTGIPDSVEITFVPRHVGRYHLYVPRRGADGAVTDVGVDLEVAEAPRPTPSASP